MPSQAASERRRAATVAGTATALGISLIGGALVLALAGPPVKKPVALETLTPPPPPSAAPSSELDSGSSGDLLSMFGEDSVGSISSADAGITSTDLGGDPLAFSPGSASALPSLPSLQLEPGQLPTAPNFPAATPFDWNAALAPLAQAQANSQAAGVTGSALGSASGLAGAAISSTAVVVGDLILYAAYANNGGPVLNQLQTLLTAAPTAVPALQGLEGLQFPGGPDLGGLNAAFAAAAASPPLGMPQLPPAPPGLPDEALAALAALPAVGLPALPPPPELPPMPDLSALLAVPAIGIPQLPGPPELPQLPRPEEVVGGVVGGLVAATIAGAVLGAIFQPPSLTRLMGLPF